jgi:hypothetical protein
MDNERPEPDCRRCPFDDSFRLVSTAFPLLTALLRTPKPCRTLTGVHSVTELLPPTLSAMHVAARSLCMPSLRRTWGQRFPFVPCSPTPCSARRPRFPLVVPVCLARLRQQEDIAAQPSSPPP